MSDSVRPQRRRPKRLLCPWDSPSKNTGVGCRFLLQSMKVKSEREVTQSCRTLHDPMDCSPPGSSVHGIFQARVLGCSKWPKDYSTFGGNNYTFGHAFPENSTDNWWDWSEGKSRQTLFSSSHSKWWSQWWTLSFGWVNPASRIVMWLPVIPSGREVFFPASNRHVTVLYQNSFLTPHLAAFSTPYKIGYNEHLLVLTQKYCHCLCNTCFVSMALHCMFPWSWTDFQTHSHLYLLWWHNSCFWGIGLQWAPGEFKSMSYLHRAFPFAPLELPKQTLFQKAQATTHITGWDYQFSKMLNFYI